MPSPEGSDVTAARDAAQRLLEQYGSEMFITSPRPSTPASSNTRAAAAESAANNLRRGEILLSITLTSKVQQGRLEDFSVSFVTSESSAVAALLFSSKQPNTSVIHQHSTLLGEL